MGQKYLQCNILFSLPQWLTDIICHVLQPLEGPTGGATRRMIAQNLLLKRLASNQNTLTSTTKNNATNVNAPAAHKLRDEVTVVTAYMNLSKFRKGEGSRHFTPDLYHSWMRIFRHIQNPLIVYLDRNEDIDYFHKLRENIPKNLTMTVKVTRNRLWSFGLRKRIAAIYAQPNYPKFHPNTVIPDYSCVMHAKYEFVQNATKSNPFRTRYFAWVDIGLFRDIVTESKPVKLHLPPNFDHSRIAYTEVHGRNTKMSRRSIFHRNKVWVAGGYFIAEKSVMQRWTAEYMRATERFLRRKLMNTDQQILYAMFCNRNASNIIQTYKGTGKYSHWFYLGYLCIE